jgi:hypothetical protein
MSVFIGPLLGLVIGLVWFECLVYLGVRRCRYANQDRRRFASERASLRRAADTARGEHQ